MHFIKRIEHPACQISLFSWNGKYIVKFEMNQLEQTYKISEIDCATESDAENAINQIFIDTVLKRFENMANDWFSQF